MEEERGRWGDGGKAEPSEAIRALIVLGLQSGSAPCCEDGTTAGMAGAIPGRCSVALHASSRVHLRRLAVASSRAIRLRRSSDAVRMAGLGTARLALRMSWPVRPRTRLVASPRWAVLLRGGEAVREGPEMARLGLGALSSSSSLLVVELVETE